MVDVRTPVLPLSIAAAGFCLVGCSPKGDVDVSLRPPNEVVISLVTDGKALPVSSVSVESWNCRPGNRIETMWAINLDSKIERELSEKLQKPPEVATIVYGQVPANFVVRTPAKPLQENVRYLVTAYGSPYGWGETFELRKGADGLSEVHFPCPH
ncbi:hypothetical protein [Labrys wisconsinensis]|uniref:Lipoprotein n=1 Tax=Labrys wisconsinensis TaxID=425677 RepID=A0ABU0JA74_9HYPH|nr:hypothetical protein [Labrys wisconsinensis]MDQ0471157.1 hypothetical protein [Labrys wisconsinensis]